MVTRDLGARLPALPRLATRIAVPRSPSRLIHAHTQTRSASFAQELSICEK
jgi:hypothetical protein